MVPPLIPMYEYTHYNTTSHHPHVTLPVRLLPNILLGENNNKPTEIDDACKFVYFFSGDFRTPLKFNI